MTLLCLLSSERCSLLDNSLPTVSAHYSPLPFIATGKCVLTIEPLLSTSLLTYSLKDSFSISPKPLLIPQSGLRPSHRRPVNVPPIGNSCRALMNLHIELTYSVHTLMQTTRTTVVADRSQFNLLELSTPETRTFIKSYPPSQVSLLPKNSYSIQPQFETFTTHGSFLNDLTFRRSPAPLPEDGRRWNDRYHSSTTTCSRLP